MKSCVFATDPRKYQECLHIPSSGNYALIPNAESASGVASKMAASKQQNLLQLAIKKMIPRDKIVLVDCPPAAADLTAKALYAASDPSNQGGVIIATEPEPQCVAKTRDFIEGYLAMCAKHSLKPRIFGMVIGRIHHSAKLHKNNVALLETLAELNNIPMLAQIPMILNENQDTALYEAYKPVANAIMAQ